jgi:hypothetical protein
MSDVSQGERWRQASDGRWYPPQDHSNDGTGSPSQAPLPESNDRSADELSTERSSVAVATARHCVNGHEMPESHVFCSVCGGEESEQLSEFSATQSDLRTGLAHKIGASYGRNGRVTPKVRILLTAVIAVCVLGLGLGLTTGRSGGSSSSTPTTNTPSVASQVQTTLDSYVQQISCVGNQDCSSSGAEVPIAISDRGAASIMNSTAAQLQALTYPANAQADATALISNMQDLATSAIYETSPATDLQNATTDADALWSALGLSASTAPSYAGMGGL